MKLHGKALPQPPSSSTRCLPCSQPFAPSPAPGVPVPPPELPGWCTRCRRARSSAPIRQAQHRRYAAARRARPLPCPVPSRTAGDSPHSGPRGLRSPGDWGTGLSIICLHDRSCKAELPHPSSRPRCASPAPAHPAAADRAQQHQPCCTR